MSTQTESGTSKKGIVLVILGILVAAFAIFVAMNWSAFRQGFRDGYSHATRT